MGKTTAFLRQSADAGYVPAIYALGSLLHDHPSSNKLQANRWHCWKMLRAQGIGELPFYWASLPGAAKAFPLTRVRYDIDQLNGLFDQDERAVIASKPMSDTCSTGKRANETRYFNQDHSSDAVQRTLGRERLGPVTEGNNTSEICYGAFFYNG